MSDDPNPRASGVAAQTEAAPGTTQKQAVEDVRYDTDQLIEASYALLNVSSDVAAAAFSLSDRKTHSLKQAEQLVKDHVERPIEIEGLPSDDEQDEEE